MAGGVEIFLPMEGLVDLEKERARLEKELAKLEGWIKGCEAKLGNEGYLNNARPELVEETRKLLGAAIADPPPP